MKEFVVFIRKQGVVGLAVGFIMGGAVSKIVASLVSDIVNPVLGVFLGVGKGLSELSFSFGPAKIMMGSFLSALVDFLVIALVVYGLVKLLKLDKLD